MLLQQQEEVRALVAPLLSALDAGRDADAWALARARGDALAAMCVGAKAALCRGLHLRAVRGGPAGGLAAPVAVSARALELAARVVEATHGADLTALKLALDVTEAPAAGELLRPRARASSSGETASAVCQ
jgi:hypothetical protein